MSPFLSKKYQMVAESIPLYLKIYHELREKIITCKFLPNEKIPSEKALCQQYSVSRHTIRHALQLLVSEGLIICKQGHASLVRPLNNNNTTNNLNTTIHLGCLNQPEVLLTQFCTQFARRVSELTTGTINVKVHHSSAYGSGTDHIEQLANGSLDIFGGAIDWLALLDPNWEVANFPFLFRNLEHLKSFMLNPLAQEIKDLLVKNHGVRVIADNWLRPSRILISRKPCFSLSDIQALRIGIPSIPIYKTVWEALGAIPVEVNWGERKKAFEANTIDATDLNWDIILSEKLYENASFATHTEHLYSRACIIINEEKYQSFRSDAQHALCVAAFETGELYSKSILDTFNIHKKSLISKNMHFIETNTKPLQDRIKKLVDENTQKNNWPNMLYQKIKQL